MPTNESEVRTSISNELPDNLIKFIRPINLRNVYNKIVDFIRDTVGYSGVQTLTDATVIAFNVSLGNSARVTLGGNRTLEISNAVAGQFYTLIVKQDGTGSRALALPVNSKVCDDGGGAISLTATANAEDIISIFFDGTYYYITKGPNYN